MKQSIETDYVTIKDAIKFLEQMGVKRSFGAVYWQVVSKKIDSKQLPRGKWKQHLVSKESLKKYGEKVLRKEGLNASEEE